jgi:phosphohistidine phosphatase
MELYLIRHAIAEPRRPGQPDATRRLTEKGRVRFARSVKGMKRLGIRLDALWHSPLLRAVETAMLLDPVLRGERQETALLARSPARPLLEMVEGERVALVGHEPWMGQLLAMLCMEEQEGPLPIPIKKGSVAILEGEPARGGMTLRAYLPPAILRRI